MVDPDPPLIPWRPYLWTLLLLALALRATYFSQLVDEDLIDSQVSAPFTDMQYFHDWAATLANGDWLGTRLAHPINDNARLMLLNHWKSEGVVGALDESDPAALRDHCDRQWGQWLGPRTWMQGPLFSYVIAGLYTLAGCAAPGLMILVNMALGLATLMLIVDLTRRAFGAGPGQLAGVLALSAIPMWSQEGHLLRSAAIQCVTVLLAWQAVSRKPMWARGLVLGIAIVLKPALVLLAPVCLMSRPQPGHPLRQTLTWVSCLLIIMTPFMARNLAVGAPALSLSANGPVTFIRSNAEDVHAGRGWQTSRHAVPIIAANGNRLIPTALATLKTRSGPSLMRHLLGKLGYLLHNFEVPNNRTLTLLQTQVPVLSVGLNTAWLVPLALLGVLISWPRRHVTAPILWAVGAHVAIILITYNLSRFRAPVLAAAIPLVAFTPWWLVSMARSPRTATLTTFLIPALGLIGLLSWKPHGIEMVCRAKAQLNSQQAHRAVTLAQQAVYLEPDYDDAWFVLGHACRDLQRPQEALDHWARCTSDLSLVHRALADAGSLHYWMSRQSPEHTETHLQSALLRYGQATLAQPFVARHHNNLALLLYKTGDLLGARVRYTASWSLQPGNPHAAAGLGKLALLDKDWRLARACYLTAVIHHDHPSPIWWHRLGLANRNLGRTGEAQRSFERALRIDPGLTLARNALETLE